MTDIEDATLLDLALGLREDPELVQAIHGSRQLRKRYRAVKRELRSLDGELHQVKLRSADDRPRLRLGAWRILLAVDDSEQSARAVDAAAALAEASAVLGCDFIAQGEKLHKVESRMLAHIREMHPQLIAGLTFEQHRELETRITSRMQVLQAEGEPLEAGGNDPTRWAGGTWACDELHSHAGFAPVGSPAGSASRRNRPLARVVTMGARVMLGYDSRPAARAALDLALGLAERLGGELLITYLFEAPEEEASLCKSLEVEGRRITNGAPLAAGSRGVRAKVIIANQRPAEGLVQIAEEHCADLLVVGSRGESPLVGALLGSTPHRLVHLSTVPLLVVPTKGDGHEDL